MLTSSVGEKLERPGWRKSIFAALAAIAGTSTCIITFFSYNFFPPVAAEEVVTVKKIGASLINYGNNGYALPFEVISILLLAAMIGAIVIAKKLTK